MREIRFILHYYNRNDQFWLTKRVFGYPFCLDKIPKFVERLTGFKPKILGLGIVLLPQISAFKHFQI